MCKFIISGMKEVDDYLDLRVCCGGVLRGNCFEATWWSRRDAQIQVDQTIYSKPLLVGGFRYVMLIVFQPYQGWFGWDDEHVFGMG